MADFGSPVAQNVNPQAGLDSLSKLMQLRNMSLQQQSLQQGLQGQAAQVQQQQQDAAQRAGLASFFKNFDPIEHMGDDGTLNLNSVFSDPKLRAAAGDQFPAVMDAMLKIKSGQLTNKQALVNLSGSTRNQFLGIVGAARTDPDVIKDDVGPSGTVQDGPGRQKLGAAIDQFSAEGPDQARIANTWRPMLEHTPAGKLVQSVSSLQLMAQSAEQQSQMQAPAYASNGYSMTNTNPQSAGGDLASNPDIRMGAPPGYVSNPLTHDIQVQPGIPGGRAGGSQAPGTTASTPASRGGSGSAPPSTQGQPASQPHGLFGLHPGDLGVTDQNIQQQRVNRTAAADAQTQLDILNRIASIAEDKSVYTGKGSDSVAAIATALGQIPGFEKAAKYSNNFNELAKFMAQNAARMGGAMGLTGSDSRLDLALHGQPNTSMDPRTIASVSQYMRGIVNMNLSKANAMDTWLKQTGHSAANEEQFEKLWRNSADPRLFQLSEMHDDPEAQKRYVGSLKIKPNEAQSLRDKAHTLIALGALPPNVL